MRAFRLIGALLVSLALIFSVAPGAEAAPAKPKESTTLIFTPPARVDKQESRKFAEAVIQDLKAVPKGSTFTYAGYLFDDPRVGDAVESAFKRGVNIRLAVESKSGGPTETMMARMAKILNKSRKSFAVRPVGSGLSKDKRASLHAKMVMFSRTGKSQNVVYLGSANLYTGNIEGSWNETQRISNNEKLYLATVKYFFDIIKNNPVKNYYWTKRVGSRTVHFLPGAPNVVRRDIARIKSCKGAAIRINMFLWHDSRIRDAEEVYKLWTKGCRVEVLGNKTRMGAKVRSTLGRPHKFADGWRTMTVLDYRTGSDYNHNKTTIITTPKWVSVWSGSANNTLKPFSVNADILVHSTNRGIAASYIRYFDRMKRYGKPMPSVTAASKDLTEEDLDYA